MTRVDPRKAARHLLPGETLLHATRPRRVGLGLVAPLAAVVLALCVYAALVEPGFLRLLVLPALPLVGALAGSLGNYAVILVTDRRIVLARRRGKSESLDLERLEDLRADRGGLAERLFGYGRLYLLLRPVAPAGEGVFHRLRLDRLPDPEGLAEAIRAAAARRSGGTVGAPPGTGGEGREGAIP